MKKISKFIYIFIIALAVVFGGCSINAKSILDRTSDLMNNFFYAENSVYSVEIYSGRRESEFEYDGKSTPKVDYGIVKVSFVDNLDAKALPIILHIDDEQKNIVLEKNPFDDSYMVDIEQQIADGAKIVVAFQDNIYEKLEVPCVSAEWGVDSQHALSVAGKTLQEFLEDASSDGDYECYLRIVHNLQNGERLFFYTFLAKTTNGKSANVVVDVNSGEVLVKA